MDISKVEEAIQAIKAGKFVIVVDDYDRENEGDLIIAAEKVTSKDIAFMVNHTTGIICVSLEASRLDELFLQQMVAENTDKHKTAFTVSVDLKDGTSTGVSAKDRAATIRALINPKVQADAFNRPGHIFPLRYREGGVLARPGHTEASLDLARLAGLSSGGVIAEIVNEDGSMARLPQLIKLAQEYNIPLISVAELANYRLRNETLVKKISSATIPTEYGDFRAIAYESVINGTHHLAFIRGEMKDAENLLVRVHSECLTGDVFGSKRCDCGDQLNMALELIAKEGRGIVIYLCGHEGRGIGLGHKMRAYQLQEEGADTVEANLLLGLPIDARDYSMGGQILKDLGVSSVRLMTNNPQKWKELRDFGIEIVERIPLITHPTKENIGYLKTKKKKLGHLLEIKFHHTDDDFFEKTG